MSRRSFALLALVVMLGTTAAHADSQLPVPEGGVVQQVPGASCAPDSAFEPADYTNWYGASCKRLHIVFGPITVKPGQNDILIQPVTIEKPQYDGYMIRFRPGLIDPTQPTGAPPVEELHLHHGTWLNASYAAGDTAISRSYGDGPWLATGEEKTIAAWPRGYGLLIKASDDWLFLHMVHNATASARVVWVTYDIDYVDASSEAARHITNTKGIWLDVGGGKFHSKTQTYPLNPVYNVMRSYGQFDPDAGRRVCSFPAQNCAAYNSLGNPAAQQGIDVTGENGIDGLPLRGMDYQIPYGFLGGTEANPGVGTLVVMGGHLHNGGVRDEVSQVRTFPDGHVEERLIHLSDAYYWKPGDPTAVGGTPTSWDFAMTGVSEQIGWKIKVQEGDILRLNALYDTELGAWWENMGIVMTWVAPGVTDGTDMFARDANGNYVVGIDRRVPVTAPIPSGNPGGVGLPGGYGCVPSATTLCVRGQVSHGHYATSDHHGLCTTNCPALQGLTVAGPMVSDIHWGAFTFGESDYSVIAANGVPRVRKGDPLTFWNADTAAYMWHTATSCGFPCTGRTTVDYPLSNGSVGVRQPDGSVVSQGAIDFDSSELGVGLGPSNRTSWTLNTANLDVGIYPYYCRIHPSMRGAFEVVPASTSA